MVREGVKVRVYDLRALNPRSVSGSEFTGPPPAPVRDASDSTSSTLPSEGKDQPVHRNQESADRNGPTYEKGGQVSVHDARSEWSPTSRAR